MNMREVYRILKKKCEEGGGGGGSPDENSDPSDGGQQGNGGGGYQFDEHDITANAPQNAEDVKDIDTKIDRAIREGALLAGRLGAKVPRSIQELLEPSVRWADELKEFVTSSMKGKDEYTWRKFNRRLVANDMYLPTVENETIGEIIVAIDTSGSIGQAQIDEFATELVSICDAVEPETVRVLWWDTMVHGEQVFRDNYDKMHSMLKPLGGGGTRVGCVAEHLSRNKIAAECVIVFTDGYVEKDPAWDITSPTLWLVTQNKSWTPPKGRKVVFEK
jgi:predicted metal-dependent peptidase